MTTERQRTHQRVTVSAEQVAVGLVDLLEGLFDLDQETKHCLAVAHQLANLLGNYRDAKGW